MLFTEAVKSAYKKAFNFSGRARRAEYWFFYLYYLIASLILTGADLVFFPKTYDVDSGQGVLGNIFVLINIVPSISIIVRRVHDTGKSGFLLLIPFVFILLFFVFPSNENWIILVGVLAAASFIYLTVLTFIKGDSGSNKYGPSPIPEERMLEQIDEDEISSDFNETSEVTARKNTTPQSLASSSTNKEISFVGFNSNGLVVRAIVKLENDEKTSFSIGRNKSDNDFHVEDDTVSRNHATLSYSDNKFSLRDDDTTNGTYVNGEFLASGKFREIKPGVIVKFGNVELKFSINFN